MTIIERLDVFEMLADVIAARNEPWRQQRECAGLPVEWFYPLQGKKMDRRARDACSQCPVAAECAAAGRYEAYGTWGGLKVKARRPGFEA